MPARQYLGDALLKANIYIEAENVFKKDLEINPNNGWSLTGLQTMYRTSGNVRALKAVNLRIGDAWLIKDTEVKNSVF